MVDSLHSDNENSPSDVELNECGNGASGASPREILVEELEGFAGKEEAENADYPDGFTEGELQKHVSELDAYAKPSPEDSIIWRTIGFPFLLIWEFITPLVVRGIFRRLQMSDIPDVREGYKAKVLLEKFHKLWPHYKNRRRPLLQILIRLFGLQFLWGGFLISIVQTMRILIPFFLAKLLEIMTVAPYNSQDEVDIAIGNGDLANGTKFYPRWQSAIWLSAMSLCQLIQIFVLQQKFHNQVRLGVKARTILTSVLYEKSLRLNSVARANVPNGKIMNILSSDTIKIEMILLFIHFGWSGFLLIVACFIFIGFILEWSVFAGLLVVGLLFPFLSLVMKVYTLFRERTLKQADKRIKAIDEILQGIKILKFYCWEDSYLQRVLSSRKKEVKEIMAYSVARSMLSSVMMVAPTVISVAMFVMYYLLNQSSSNPLQPSIVFPTISYIGTMRLSIAFLAVIIGFTVESNISLKRMEEFMNQPEMEPKESGTDEDHPIRLINASFEWEEKKVEPPKKGKLSFRKKKETVIDIEKEKPAKLTNINLEVKKGDLVCIVGDVGSGKSSLLQAMLGEMRQTDGEIQITGTMAYCPQSAWVQSATLLDNVLFGLPYEESRFNMAVSSTTLDKDISEFEGGRLMEIGEKGINLSGGQLQRVSLARAVYWKTDIVLLDSILSAVDAHVGSHIVQNCILGSLKDRTRILVTHQLQYVHHADLIVVMKDGEIAEQGTYNELMANEDSLLKKEINQFLATKHDDDASQEDEVNIEKRKEGDNKVEEQDSVKGKLMIKEERNTGSISWRIWFSLIKSIGGPLVLLFLCIFFLITQAGLVAPDWYLSEWMGRRFPNVSNDGHLGIYGGLAVVAGILAFSRDLIFYVLMVRGSSIIHNRAIQRVIRAPQSFFDSTPLGRIISRFSRDVEIMDSQLIVSLTQFLNTFLQVISIFIIIAIATNGIFLIPLIPLVVLYYAFQEIYRKTSREIKRLDSVSRSPLFSHFSETLTGLPTIRAYNQMQRFQVDNQKRVNYHNRASYLQHICTRWLSIRLEFIGATIVVVASVTSLLLAFFAPASWNLNNSLLALGITYSLQVSQFLAFAVRNVTETEVHMNCVERLVHYHSVENEPPAIIANNRPPTNWPENGKIEFVNYSMRYRPELPPVLKNINLTIKGKEKVGIVGRTGAGKSSLLLGLFRLVQQAESDGKILIDDINISEIGLKDCRNALSIIPQAPVLFSGTIRSNLDPFQNYSDQQIWKALDQAELAKVVRKLPKTIYTKVSEGGANFSVGERQLLCLARSLLKKSRIVVLDEATSSIDMKNDDLVQETIRKNFAESTVITIAHRINTIIYYDKILFLDNGEIREFDSPANLLRDPNSWFSGLVRETGKSNEKHLRDIAFSGSKNFQRSSSKPSIESLDSESEVNPNNSIDTSLPLDEELIPKVEDSQQNSSNSDNDNHDMEL